MVKLFYYSGYATLILAEKDWPRHGMMAYNMQRLKYYISGPEFSLNFGSKLHKNLQGHNCYWDHFDW